MGFQKEIVQNFAQQDNLRKSVGKSRKTVLKKKTSSKIKKTKKTSKKKTKKSVKKNRWVKI